eukprot:8333283-Pyramimonas_sp.AAC.1
MARKTAQACRSKKRRTSAAKFSRLPSYNRRPATSRSVTTCLAPGEAAHLVSWPFLVGGLSETVSRAPNSAIRTGDEPSGSLAHL